MRTINCSSRRKSSAAQNGNTIDRFCSLPIIWENRETATTISTTIPTMNFCISLSRQLKYRAMTTSMKTQSRKSRQSYTKDWWRRSKRSYATANVTLRHRQTLKTNRDHVRHQSFVPFPNSTSWTCNRCLHDQQLAKQLSHPHHCISITCKTHHLHPHRRTANEERLMRSPRPVAVPVRMTNIQQNQAQLPTFQTRPTTMTITFSWVCSRTWLSSQDLRSFECEWEFRNWSSKNFTKMISMIKLALYTLNIYILDAKER